MNKNRSKLFLENFFVYGIGSIISKVIPIIILPIITRLLPAEYYGVSDLSNIAVTFCSAIAIMGMYDAMFRMFFEKDDIQYKKEICSSVLCFVLITGTIISILLFIFRYYFSNLIFSNKKYVNLLSFTSISIFISTLSSIVVAPTRMENKRKIFLIINTLSPVIGYFISIPMIINKKYLYALPTATLVTSLIQLIIYYILNNKWFNFKKVNFKYIKEMLKIGAPLMPSFIMYWIFTSSSRLIISKIMGNEFVGIYGIGSRVASISQFVYTAFAAGWQYFAFSTMKDDDQVELTSKIFEYLALVSFSIVIMIIPFTYFIFDLLFDGNYVNGYIVFPYLFLSPLLLMLYQTIINQFLIIKKTWPSTLILTLGAIVNLILNNYLVNYLGIEGSAIATLIGYIVSILLAVFILKRNKLLKLKPRVSIISLLLFIFIICWRLISSNKILPSLIIGITILLIYIYLYKRDVKNIILKFKSNI